MTTLILLNNMKIKQKDIFWANLNPSKGSEQAGKRPVVVISAGAMNDNMPICIVCPISGQVKEYPACVVLLKSKHNGLKKDSEILTFQIRTISQDRLTKKIGNISNSQLKSVFDGLRDVLLTT